MILSSTTRKQGNRGCRAFRLIPADPRLRQVTSVLSLK
jgi:hypothetical protein